LNVWPAISPVLEHREACDSFRSFPNIVPTGVTSESSSASLRVSVRELQIPLLGFGRNLAPQRVSTSSRLKSRQNLKCASQRGGISDLGGGSSLRGRSALSSGQGIQAFQGLHCAGDDHAQCPSRMYRRIWRPLKISAVCIGRYRYTQIVCICIRIANATRRMPSGRHQGIQGIQGMGIRRRPGPGGLLKPGLAELTSVTDCSANP
jgi:hypothetical protein